MQVEILACCFTANGRSPRLYVKLRLPFGMILHDIKINASGGKLRVQHPYRPMFRSNVHIRDEAGNLLFAPMLTFDNREAGEAFTAAVLDAVRDAYPELLAKVLPPSMPAHEAGAAA